MSDTPHEDRACARCGSSGGFLLDIGTGSVCHAEPYQCIHWLRVDNITLRSRLPNEEYERFVRVSYPQMYERLRDAGSEPVTVHIEERANGEVLLVARTHDCPDVAALRADKERLDWLELACAWSDDTTVAIEGLPVVGSIRAAIDAAEGGA